MIEPLIHASLIIYLGKGTPKLTHFLSEFQLNMGSTFDTYLGLF